MKILNPFRGLCHLAQAKKSADNLLGRGKTLHLKHINNILMVRYLGLEHEDDTTAN